MEKPDIINNPATDLFWESFIGHCQKLNAFREGEDYPAYLTRQDELEFLSSLGIAPGQEAWARATLEDTRLARLQKDRNETDARLCRALFEGAVKLGVYMAEHPYVMQPGFFSDPAAAAVTAEGNLLFPCPQELHSEVEGNTSETTMPTAGTSLNPAYRRASEAPAPDAFEAPPLPGTITMAEVGKGDVIVPFPRTGNTKYYLLRCPYCDRLFQSAHGMFGHMAQSDEKHLSLFNGKKNFIHAVELTGTEVVDATRESVELHNFSAIEILMSPVGKDGI